MRNLIFYIIGGFSIFLISSCTDRVQGYKTNWIFINETNHFIKYTSFTYDTIYTAYNLMPFDTVSKTEINEGGKEIELKNYVSILRPNAVVYDGLKCLFLDYSSHDFLTDSGPAGMNNYEFRVISKKRREYELIYRFTESDYDKAVLCNADTASNK